MEVAMSTARKGTRLSAGDVPKGLLWIDGITGSQRSGWSLDAICLNNRRVDKDSLPLETGLVAPLVDIQADHFRVSKTEMFVLKVPNLEMAEKVIDPADVLRSIVPSIRSSQRHSLFKVRSDPAVYVPALLLIRMLYTGNKLLDSLLLIENGIDLLGSAQIADGIAEITPGPAYSNPNKKPVIPQIAAWMQLCLDARRSHGSVLEHFRRGEIGFHLPHVSFECWAWGISTDVGVLVTELNGVDMRLPIPSDQIVVRMGDIRHKFKSYSPMQKSPLSRSSISRRNEAS